MATIGNFADQPRGNLNEIGTGLGVLRTTAGERFGVDVDNPRFGMASDLLPLALAVTAKPRGGHTKIQGDTVTVYRIEGEPNTRLVINRSYGRVHVVGDEAMLHLNFGQWARAVEYLHQKIEGGLPGAELKSFEVPRSFLEELRRSSVKQTKAAVEQYPDRPQVVGRSRARDQFGLRKEQIEELQRTIVQGTGKVDGVGKPADVLPPSGLGYGGATLPLTLKRDKSTPE